MLSEAKEPEKVAVTLKKASDVPKKVFLPSHSEDSIRIKPVWLLIKLLIYLQSFFTQIYNKSEEKVPKCCIHAVEFFGLFAHLSLLIAWLIANPMDTVGYALFLANGFFSLLLFACLISQFIDVFREKQISQSSIRNQFIASVGYSVSSLCNLSIVLHTSTFYSSALLACAFLGSCYYSVPVVVISFVAIFVFLLGIGESIFRFLICRVECYRVSCKENTYQPYLFEKAKVDSSSCTICLHEFKENDVVCVLNCHSTHVYHEKCLLEWLRERDICPLCKAFVSFA